MSSKSNASSGDVRTWLSENGHTVGTRGRFSAEQIDAYHKANKGRAYSPATSGRMIAVKVTLKDSRGRNRSKTVEVSPTEYRELTGTVGAKGRVSAKAHAVAVDTLTARLSQPVVVAETPSAE